MQNWKAIATDPDRCVRTWSRNIFLGYAALTIVSFLFVELRLGLRHDIATAEGSAATVSAQDVKTLAAEPVALSGSPLASGCCDTKQR